MLYTKGYFEKELRQTYVEGSPRSLKKVAYGLFLGLFSFALYFLLQTMSQTVLADVFPNLMQPSYFSTLSLYNATAYAGFLLYFLFQYDSASFAEIGRNIWYMLLKMGYHPYPMIFSKIIALILSMALVYSTGFLFTAVLTVFLKFNFIFGYLLSLYLVGFMDLLIIGMAFMAISLFARGAVAGRYLLLLAAVAQLAFRVTLGYRAVIVNRIAMQNAAVLLDFRLSHYLPYAAVFILTSMLVCLFAAKRISQYYNLPYETYGYALPNDAKIVMRKGINQTPVSIDTRDKRARRGRILNIATIAVLTALIVLSLLFNVFILLLSASQPGTEAVINGMIPILFKSDTLEPAIKENDLAFFKKADAQYQVSSRRHRAVFGQEHRVRRKGPGSRRHGIYRGYRLLSPNGAKGRHAKDG